MAIIFRSRGTVGPGSKDNGTPMPLEVIDKRLKAFRIFCHGEKPKTMLPQSREHYIHIMIEVTEDDFRPQLERFSRPGFYQVVGLRVPDAGFLSSRIDQGLWTNASAMEAIVPFGQITEMDQFLVPTSESQMLGRAFRSSRECQAQLLKALRDSQELRLSRSEV